MGIHEFYFKLLTAYPGKCVTVLCLVQTANLSGVVYDTRIQRAPAMLYYPRSTAYYRSSKVNVIVINFIYRLQKSSAQCPHIN